MAINTQNAGLLISAGFPGQFPKINMPQVAFSGRSNVGKSSLINALIGRKIARTSSTPGKTVTVNFYNIDDRLILADLPGYGYAKRGEYDKRAWSALVESYFNENENIDLLTAVVQLIDLKIGPTVDDDMMFDWYRQTRTPFIIAATKADKLNATDRERNLSFLARYYKIPPETPIIPFSAQTGEGKNELLREILKFIK